MTARLQQLDEIEQSIWSELESCVAARPRPEPGEPEVSEPPHEWRVAVLATLDGGQADARSIVLREVDAAERRLIFYTDARSPKVRQIEASPQGTLIFHSRELGWQLRMQVRLAVETTGLAVSSRLGRRTRLPVRHRPGPPARRPAVRARRARPFRVDRSHGRDGGLAGTASRRPSTRRIGPARRPLGPALK
jgi:hypothetical protein